MSLVLDITTPEEARLGVWRIEEDSSFFSERLLLSDTEQSSLSILNSSKRLEWLASRFVLDQITNHSERIETSTRPSGKPYLIGRKEHISLSHSDAYVAAMIGDSDVGIDIQRCKDKIVRLEHKFANTMESACIDRSQAVLHLHILWSAKEALYKIYARKQLNFISHIFIDLPKLIQERGRFSGVVHAPDKELLCILDYLIIENYVLVYAQRAL
ncbi:MAG TPA: 4'-phosphopantetheinyl transferase superfamily protein [Saprospiraceae bacterium]|nr:4'-phosphopantetheinyl transferase superfamily protein [Saprospiraceae bacterium]